MASNLPAQRNLKGVMKVSWRRLPAVHMPWISACRNLQKCNRDLSTVAMCSLKWNHAVFCFPARIVQKSVRRSSNCKDCTSTTIPVHVKMRVWMCHKEMWRSALFLERTALRNVVTPQTNTSQRYFYVKILDVS